MRRARRAVSEGHDVTVARTHQEALRLAQTERFDVAIIDLGWYGDPAVGQADRPVAGWKIANAVEESDQKHPQLRPTAQIIYSARFDTQPQLAERAASTGRLPILKPYKERDTIPLESQSELEKSGDKVDAACQTLRATLSFIEHQRDAGTSLLDGYRQGLGILLNAATEGVSRAGKRAERWDSLTRFLLTLGILIILAGVVSIFFLGVPAGTVTAAVGIVVGLIPRLMYGELHQAQADIQTATKEMVTLVQQAQALSSESQPHVSKH
jgi:CheY-like chemotaxis protein